MDLYHSLAGYVRVELTSADIAGTIHEVNAKNIVISDLEIIGDLTVRFTVSRQDFKYVLSLAKRKGEQIALLSRVGVFWKIWNLRNRQMLAFGMILLLFLTLILPTRILFVEVAGNEKVPQKMIIEAAQNAGIDFGAGRRDLRSEKVKNMLLGSLPHLQWVGVNTYGCRAIISVRERSEKEQPRTENCNTRIVAFCEGVITECTVIDGTGLCGVGQAVRKGQVLISGYTDCGGVVTVGRAEGEVFAATRHEITGVMPSQSLIRSDFGKTKAKFSLCIGKKRINLYKGSGISATSCVKMVSKYNLALPGGYVLPVALIREDYTPCVMQTSLLEPARMTEMLSSAAQTYLRGAGVARAIVDAQESFTTEEDVIRLNGIYSCVEMIGREQAEQIGDIHGKTD